MNNDAGVKLASAVITLLLYISTERCLSCCAKFKHC